MFFALGFFDVCRFCDNAEKAAWLKMPSRLTAVTETGERGLAERVSRRPFRLCIFFAHWRQPTRVCRRVYCLSGDSLRSGWYWCVHDVHGPNGLNHSRSASPSSPAYVTAVGHEGIFSETSSSSSPKQSDANISNVPEIQENTKKVTRTESGTVAMQI